MRTDVAEDPAAAVPVLLAAAASAVGLRRQLRLVLRSAAPDSDRRRTLPGHRTAKCRATRTLTSRCLLLFKGAIRTLVQVMTRRTVAILTGLCWLLPYGSSLLMLHDYFAWYHHGPDFNFFNLTIPEARAFLVVF